MKFHNIRIATLGTVALLTPLAIPTLTSAQMTPQNSQTSPNGQQQPSGTAMQDSGTNASQTSQTMKDKMFLRKASQGGMAEVKLGQLAVQKASSDDVKQFGQKMVDDHTALNNEMAPIADSMGVRAPTMLSKEDQAEYDKLNALSGTDFDTEYLKAMVKDHRKDLREFRAEAASTQDPTLKAAVEKAEKVIQEHHQMVDKLAQQKGITMPGHGPNKPSPAGN